jgi:hypothetical protein
MFHQTSARTSESALKSTRQLLLGSINLLKRLTSCVLPMPVIPQSATRLPELLGQPGSSTLSSQASSSSRPKNRWLSHPGADRIGRSKTLFSDIGMLVALLYLRRWSMPVKTSVIYQ